LFEHEHKKQQDIRKLRKVHSEEDIKELPNELCLGREEQFVDCDGNVPSPITFKKSHCHAQQRHDNYARYIVYG